MRITAIEGAGTQVLVTSAAGQVSSARVGTGLRDGDRVHVVGTSDAKVEAVSPGLDRLTLERAFGVSCNDALIGDAVIRENVGHVSAYNAIPIQAVTTECGKTEVQSATAARQRSLHQAGAMGAGALALTPEAQAQVSGRARIIRDPRRGLTTVANLHGSVEVRPANPALGGLRLVPGQQVHVTRSSIGRPFDLVPNLENEIPSPRQVRAGPALVTAPSRLSLRSLRTSKCVRVAVSSSRPARVLVTIFSGRRSVRLFGQRLVRFAAPGRTTTCILVPRRARTFDVRTRLSFAVGYALGARARPGERPTRPVVRPITLVP